MSYVSLTYIERASQPVAEKGLVKCETFHCEGSSSERVNDTFLHSDTLLDCDKQMDRQTDISATTKIVLLNVSLSENDGSSWKNKTTVIIIHKKLSFSETT